MNGTDFSQSNVKAELDRFVEIGMLSDIPRSAGERRQYYVRQDSHPWWTIIQMARQVVTGGVEAEERR